MQAETAPVAPPSPLAHLLGHARPADAVMAWRNGQPVTWAACERDVLAQAQALREQASSVVLLSAQRYTLGVTLLAAMVRGQHCWLPPNERTDTLDHLAGLSPQAYGLTDRTLSTTALPMQAVVAHAPWDRTSRAASPEPAQTVWPEGWDPEAHRVSLFTSGSTGVPQACHRSWHWLRTTVMAQAQGLAECLGWPSLAGLQVVSTVPSQHSYGLESALLLPWMVGGALESARPFFPADISAALHALPRPRALVTTPYHLKHWLAAQVDIPSLDLVVSATAPLSPALARAAEQATGGRLVEVYGCTEVGPMALRCTAKGQVWTTLGTLGLYPCSAPEAHQGIAGQGVCEVRGGHLAQGVVLADRFVVHDAQNFELLGRANDVIQVAGKRNSLANLNFQLQSIEGVMDGVCWMPDDEADSVVRPVALVVAPDLSASAIMACLRERLEPVFVPRCVIHVPALPRETTGKLPAQRLAAFAKAQLQARALAAQAPSTPYPEGTDHDCHARRG